MFSLVRKEKKTKDFRRLKVQKGRKQHNRKLDVTGWRRRNVEEDRTRHTLPYKPKTWKEAKI